MKKIVASFILIIAFLSVLLLFSSGGFILATLFTHGNYSVYGSALPEEEYALSPINACFETFLESERGIAVRFNSVSDAEKLVDILQAEEISAEKFDTFTIKTYRSPFIRHSETVRGERVNLQIAVSNDGTVTAGTPLLLGSY